MDQQIHELHERATQLFEEGKYAEAEPLLKNVISSNPKFADVHNKLGIISHLKGHVRQAAEYFKKAIELNPSYTEASLNLAITYNDMGEFRQAQEIFSVAAQIAHPTPSAMDPFIAGKIANEHYKIETFS
jgi:Tfp pilus assembly protein PilF